MKIVTEEVDLKKRSPRPDSAAAHIEISAGMKADGGNPPPRFVKNHQTKNPKHTNAETRGRPKGSWWGRGSSFSVEIRTVLSSMDQKKTVKILHATRRGRATGKSI